MKTVIVIPCYNEAERLPQEELLRYAQTHPDTALLLANDGSRDNTLEVLKALCERYENLHLLDIQPNGGKAEAVRQGILHATLDLSPDYVAFWDADMATPLNEVEGFVAWMDKGYDMVTGLRLMRLGAEVSRRPLRHYLGRCFATCASLVLGLPAYDTQCGAKMFRSELVVTLFNAPFVTHWLFDVELLARYERAYGKQRAKEKIYELPLFHWQDVAGSKLKSRDFLKAPAELLKIWRSYMRKR